MSSPAFEDSVLTLWPPRVSPNEMACHSSSLSKLSSPPHGHSLPLEYERAFLLFILSLLLSHMGLSQPILPSLSPFCATSPKSTHPQRLSANSGPSIETPLTPPAPTEILLWPFLSDPMGTRFILREAHDIRGSIRNNKNRRQAAELRGCDRRKQEQRSLRTRET